MRLKAFIDEVPTFKMGDPCPDGYNARIEWASVHMRAGLKQKRCCICCLWCFPHELSGIVWKSEAFDNRGKVHTLESPICKDCEAKRKGTPTTL